jgi:hypothetical protein
MQKSVMIRSKNERLLLPIDSIHTPAFYICDAGTLASSEYPATFYALILQRIFPKSNRYLSNINIFLSFCVIITEKAT